MGLMYKQVLNQETTINYKDYNMARDIFTSYGRYLEFFNYKDTIEIYEKYLDDGAIHWKEEIETAYNNWLNYVHAKECHSNMSDELLKSWFFAQGGVNYIRQQATLNLRLTLGYFQEEQIIENLTIMDRETEEEYNLHNWNWDEKDNIFKIYDNETIIEFETTNNSDFAEMDEEEHVFIIDRYLLHFNEDIEESKDGE
jgi:hypothetical protein